MDRAEAVKLLGWDPPPPKRGTQEDADQWLILIVEDIVKRCGAASVKDSQESLQIVWANSFGKDPKYA